jgi:hypothetical protein
MKEQEKNSQNNKKRKFEDENENTESSNSDSSNTNKKAKTSNYDVFSSSSQSLFYHKLSQLVDKQVNSFLGTTILSSLQITQKEKLSLLDYYKDKLCELKKQAKTIYLSNPSVAKEIWKLYENNAYIITGKVLNLIDSILIKNEQPDISNNSHIRSYKLKEYFKAARNQVSWGEFSRILDSENLNKPIITTSNTKKARSSSYIPLNQLPSKLFNSKIAAKIYNRHKVIIKDSILAKLSLPDKVKDDIHKSFINTLQEFKNQVKKFYSQDGSQNEIIWDHFNSNLDTLTGRILVEINQKLLEHRLPKLEKNSSVIYKEIESLIGSANNTITWGSLVESNNSPDQSSCESPNSKHNFTEKLRYKIGNQSRFFRKSILLKLSIDQKDKDELLESLVKQLNNIKEKAIMFYLEGASEDENIWNCFNNNLAIVTGRMINEVNLILVANNLDTIKHDRKYGYDYFELAKQEISWEDLQYNNEIDPTTSSTDLEFDPQNLEHQADSYLSNFYNENLDFDYWYERLNNALIDEEYEDLTESITNSINADSTDSFYSNNSPANTNQYNDYVSYNTNTPKTLSYCKEINFKEESHQLKIKIKYIDEFLEELPEWIHQSFSKLKAFLEEIHSGLQSIFSNHFAIKFANYESQDSSVDEFDNNKNEYKALTNYNAFEDNFEFMIEPGKSDLTKLVAMGSADINNLFNYGYLNLI